MYLYIFGFCVKHLLTDNARGKVGYWNFGRFWKSASNLVAACSIGCSALWFTLHQKKNLNKSTFMIYFIKPNTKFTVITQFDIQNYSLFSAYLKKNICIFMDNTLLYF